MSSQNAKLNSWVAEIESLCQPDRVQWCDGSKAEYDEMIRLMLASGTARAARPKRPNSYLVWSDPRRRRARRGPHLHLLRASRIDAGPTTTGATPTR